MDWSIIITFILSFIIGYFYGKGRMEKKAGKEAIAFVDELHRQVKSQKKGIPSFSISGKVKGSENPSQDAQDRP